MQYNRYYSNSSVIVDFAVGQIPRFTERISRFFSIYRRHVRISAHFGRMKIDFQFL